MSKRETGQPGKTALGHSWRHLVAHASSAPPPALSAPAGDLGPSANSCAECCRLQRQSRKLIGQEPIHSTAPPQWIADKRGTRTSSSRVSPRTSCPRRLWAEGGSRRGRPLRLGTRVPGPSVSELMTRNLIWDSHRRDRRAGCSWGRTTPFSVPQPTLRPRTPFPPSFLRTRHHELDRRGPTNASLIRSVHVEVQSHPGPDSIPSLLDGLAEAPTERSSTPPASRTLTSCLRPVVLPCGLDGGHPGRAGAQTAALGELPFLDKITKQVGQACRALARVGSQ